MPKAPTKLAAYLAKKKESHRAFAARAGFAHLHPMVGLWARGVRFPDVEHAFAIESATVGEVPASHWAALKRAKKSRRRTTH